MYGFVSHHETAKYYIWNQKLNTTNKPHAQNIKVRKSILESRSFVATLPQSFGEIGPVSIFLDPLSKIVPHFASGDFFFFLVVDGGMEGSSESV